MLRTILLILIISLATSGLLPAQTRRIAHASHSGSATATDDDNFGETPQMRKAWHEQDSVRKAQADSAERAEQLKQHQKEKPLKRSKPKTKH